MNKAKHTKLPWRVSRDELDYGNYDILAKLSAPHLNQSFPNTGIATTVDARFSEMDKYGSCPLHKDECEANADYIVKACNNYEVVGGYWGYAQ